MATENPMRIVDNSGAGKWAPPRGSAAFASSTTRVVTDELGLLLRGHNIERDHQSSIAPNRSGSAPPSMEGSFAAFGNNWRSPSWDARDAGSTYISRTSLSTHEEEPEDDKGASDDRAKSTSIMFGQNTLSFSGRHKSLVDLLQEGFPRTPSPQNRYLSHVEEPLNHDMQSLSLDPGARKIDIPAGSTAIKNPPINPSELTSKDAYFTSDGIIDSDASRSLYEVEDVHDKEELGFDKQNELLHPQNTYSQHAAGYHVPRSQVQQTNNINYGHFKMNPVEMQPLHDPGVPLPPPLYANSAAYMAPGNSYATNFSASGLYTPPPYSGYSMDSFFPPYLAGYPPQTDPYSLHYFQQPMQDPYGVPVQYAHLPSLGDQKFQFPPSGNLNVGSPSARKIRVPSSSSYLSSPTGLGFVPQFPSSPLGSPVLPASPVGGASSLGRGYDIGFSQTSPRNVSGYARWQGQSINDYRKHSFLEELKASSARRIDLSDVVGRIAEFSIDQHGSRFIQQKLENCSLQEKESVFKEVLPHASKLITDVFGNYVIQKFFEHGTYEQRKELANQLSGQMLPLSLQMYGCRVIQKALEVIEVDQKTELVLELDGHVVRCVRDQNGNHVIQKCIECMPAEKIDFIISAFQGQVAILSSHPYGCRVIQRVLEHCSDDLRCRSIVNEILESACDLARDQYGNYVTQHVLERGKPFERSQIIRKLAGKIVQMSQHKYASNVVEKCLEFGDVAEQEFLIKEILLQSEDNDNLLAMMKDQFANYVVQKILEISSDKQRETLLDRIRLHLIALKKYTYGKHIVARFEQLCGEDNGTSEP